MTKQIRGVSFIETMVAMVILLVGLMGLGIAFQRSISQANASKNDGVAMTLATGIVDNLESRPFSDWDDESFLPSVAQEFYADFEGNLLSGSDLSSAFFKPTITLLQDYSTHRDIRITVDWNQTGNGGLQEMRKAGFISNTATHAFVMDATIAQLYGETIFGGGTTP